MYAWPILANQNVRRDRNRRNLGRKKKKCELAQQQNTAYLCYLSNLFPREILIPHFLENNNNKTIDY